MLQVPQVDQLLESGNGPRRQEKVMRTWSVRVLPPDGGAAPSPGGTHAQQLPVSQGNQALQQEAAAAVGEQELGVALPVD